MTEREAIEVLNNFDMQVSAKADGAYQSTIGEMACKVAVMALAEIQQYRAIGTVEECREAREKQTPKQPTLYGGEDGKMICPSCNKDLWDLRECGFDFCPYCSQAIKFGGI